MDVLLRNPLLGLFGGVENKPDIKPQGPQPHSSAYTDGGLFGNT